MSAADRVGRAGHGQLIASPLTLALLGYTGAKSAGHLGVPLHRRFTLGTLRLELIASGRGPGATALHVDIAGRTVLYAGAVRPQPDDARVAVEVAEVRACNALVVAAPYGDEHHRFPPLADTIARTVEWAAAQLAEARHAVLVVDGVLEGLEVATVLREVLGSAIAIVAGRSIREAARRGELADKLALRGEPARRAQKSGPQVVIALAADRGSLVKLDGEHRIATLSVEPSREAGDVSLPWANAADRAGLLAWIESTHAREVFVTGACAESIAHALGPKARMIGPPHQMALALFPDDGEVAT